MKAAIDYHDERCRRAVKPVIDRPSVFDAQGAFGSYGINHWINSLPSSFANGWQERPRWHWSAVAAVLEPSITPVFADCAWYGGNPFDLQTPGNGGKPPPRADWNKQANPPWDWDMGRFVMPRHGRAINAAFVDGSTRAIKLETLWDLAWHREFRRTNSVKLAW